MVASDRGRTGCAAASGHTDRVGFNPHRIHRRRPSDYVFVAAAVVTGVLLVAWVLAG
jgi:hypothetical protein